MSELACPFFHPDTPLTATPEARPAPLGDLYGGTCHDSYAPSETEARQWCNFGYARKHCQHFPGGDAPDAIHFAMAEGGAVRFVLERDHRPVAHGTFLRIEGTALHGDPAIARLAGAYVAAFDRRKSKT